MYVAGADGERTKILIAYGRRPIHDVLKGKKKTQ